MEHDQCAATLVHIGADQVENPKLLTGVQRSYGLIRDEQRRFGGKRARTMDAGQLPA